MTTSAAGRWEGLRQEFAEIGCDYRAEQLSDPDWCARELARKGYAVSLMMITSEYMREKMEKEPSDLLPNWTYHLWHSHSTVGEETPYANRTLAECAATALFNACRLESSQKTKQ
jgi:hypothetical protein